MGNPKIFRTLIYLKPNTYSGPYQRVKMECFVKIIKTYKYFSKTFFFRSFTASKYANLLIKCSLTCRVTSHYTLYGTDLEPYLLWSNSGIIKHIFAYWETCVILTYSEPCHIQNLGIFRTQDIFRTLSRHVLANTECVRI